MTLQKYNYLDWNLIKMKTNHYQRRHYLARTCKHVDFRNLTRGDEEYLQFFKTSKISQQWFSCNAQGYTPKATFSSIVWGYMEEWVEFCGWPKSNRPKRSNHKIRNKISEKAVFYRIFIYGCLKRCIFCIHISVKRRRS